MGLTSSVGGCGWSVSSASTAERKFKFERKRVGSTYQDMQKGKSSPSVCVDVKREKKKIYRKEEQVHRRYTQILK